MKNGLRLGTAAQSAPLIVGYVLSFISAPIIVSGLGVAGFGVWAVTGALAQYGALLDLGIAKAVIRFVALYEGGRDRRAQGEILVVALIALSLVGLVLSILAWPLGYLIAGAFSEVSVADARWIVFTSMMTLTLITMSRAVAAFSIGRQSMVVPNAVLVVNAGVTFTGVVVCMQVAPRLTAFGTANMATAALSLLLSLTAVSIAEGRVPVAWPSWVRAREMLSYSWKSQVAFVSDVIVFQSDKVIIGVLAGAGPAGAYELGSRVAMAARSLAVLPLTALLPSLTERVSDVGVKSLEKRYFELTTRAAAVGFPPLVFIGFGAPVLLVAWLDSVPRYAVPVAVVIALASLVNVASGVASATTAAAGAAGVLARAGIVTAVVNLALAGVLGPIFGVGGVLAATGIASVASGILVVVMVHRAFDLRYQPYVAAVRGPLLLSLTAGIPVLMLSLFAAPSGRGEAIVAGGVGFVSFAIIYLVGNSRFVYLPINIRRRATQVGR